jgi:hypothetical protein
LTVARELDYRLGVLSASELGTPVYLRLGFRIVGDVTVLVVSGRPRRRSSQLLIVLDIPRRGNGSADRAGRSRALAVMPPTN